MVNATTYSNPKEMLGYLIVQELAHVTEVKKQIYYDRKAALTVSALLGGLDAKMSSFRNEMFYLYYDKSGKPVRLDYGVAKKKIDEHLKESESLLYEKNYSSYLDGIIMWETLIASCFPRLGLVPETHEYSEEKEGMVVDEPFEEEQENQVVEDLDENEPVGLEDKQEPGERTIKLR